MNTLLSVIFKFCTTKNLYNGNCMKRRWRFFSYIF